MLTSHQAKLRFGLSVKAKDKSTMLNAKIITFISHAVLQNKRDETAAYYHTKKNKLQYHIKSYILKHMNNYFGFLAKF